MILVLRTINLVIDPSRPEYPESAMYFIGKRLKAQGARFSDRYRPMKSTYGAFF
jgi:hypothetical protein